MIIAQWQAFTLEEMYAAGYDEDYDPYWTGGDDEVDVYPSSVERIDYILTAGVGPHDDKMFPQYSVFLVTRNDGFIAIGSNQNYDDFPIQTPGTIIVMDIHAFHHCWYDPRWKNTHPNSKYDLWVAAVTEYETDRFMTYPDWQQRIEQFWSEFLAKDDK